MVSTLFPRETLSRKIVIAVTFLLCTVFLAYFIVMTECSINAIFASYTETAPPCATGPSILCTETITVICVGEHGYALWRIRVYFALVAIVFAWNIIFNSVWHWCRSVFRFSEHLNRNSCQYIFI